MHLYLDSADREALARCLPHPLIYGVTTNPTLLRRAGLAWERLPDLVAFALGQGARAVQVQVRHQDAEGMLADAERCLGWGAAGQIVVKLPASRAGLLAAATLAAKSVPVTVTAVYGPEQAVWAAHLGARYAAPYLGRLEDLGQRGLEVVGRMQAALGPYPETRLLVASLRSRAAVADVLTLGVGAITLPPDLFLEVLEHPETRRAEAAFLADAHVPCDIHE